MKVEFEAKKIKGKVTIALEKKDWNIEEVKDVYVITPKKD